MSDTPDSSGSQQSTPAAPPLSASGTDDRYDTGSALLRLMVGGMLFGADELRDRLRRWEEATYLPTQATPPQPASASLGRALIGLAFETETRVRRGATAMLARLVRLADDGNLAYARLAWSVRGTPLDLIRRRLDEMLFLTLEAIDRWTARGWIEEQQGRRLAAQATASVIDELLDYMARNPEVRQLIEQQGIGMADSAVDEVRERTVSADQWVERIAHSLLRRPSSDKLARPEDAASMSPPAPSAPPTAEAPPASS